MREPTLPQKPLTQRANRSMTIRHRAIFVAGMAAFLAACSETVVPDLNNSTESQFAVVQNRTQLQQLATGLMDVDRRTHDFQILVNETVARDVFRMDAAETRYLTQPLGATQMSNSVFIGQSVYSGPYRAIRSAQNFIGAVTAAPANLPVVTGTEATPFTANDRRAVIGYAQTIKALSYMRLIEQRDTLGIAFYTSPADINPILCKENVLASIAAILDSGYADLTAGAEEFAFELPSGFSGFDTPETFAEFNRGLKAKVAYYQAFDLFARTGGATPAASGARTIDAAALTEAEQALAASFMVNDAEDLSGPFYTYSAASGDYVNPNFNQNLYRINPRVLTESEGVVFTGTGNTLRFTAVPDKRLVAKADTAIGAADCKTVEGVNSCLVDLVNTSNTSPIALLRNDELLLLRAQLYWGRGQYQSALDIVNAFRTAAELPGTLTLASFGGGDGFDPANAADQDRLMDEILRQKRNQLLFESASRLPDFRMFGYLAKLGPERGNQPIAVFPHPLQEEQARGGNLSRTCN